MDQNPNNTSSTPNSPMGFAQYEGYINMLQTVGGSSQAQFQSQFGGGSSQAQFQPQFQSQFSTQVPETQIPQEVAPQEKRKGKKKTKDVQSAPKRWDEEELICLAISYCLKSKNEIQGNQRKSRVYWEEVLHEFYARMKRGPYRNNDSLSGKWRELNEKCTKFNGIYNNILSQKISGANGLDILRIAKEKFSTTYHTEFQYERVWEVLRRDPKWTRVPTFEEHVSQDSGSKRSRTSGSRDVSDAHTNFDLNAEETDEVAEEVEEEVARPTRPTGRDNAKRAMRFGEKEERKTKHMQVMEDRFAEHCSLQKEKNRLREEHLQLAREEKDLEIISRNEIGLAEADLVILRAMKEKARARLMRNM